MQPSDSEVRGVGARLAVLEVTSLWNRWRCLALTSWWMYFLWHAASGWVRQEVTKAIASCLYLLPNLGCVWKGTSCQKSCFLSKLIRGGRDLGSPPPMSFERNWGSKDYTAGPLDWHGYWLTWVFCMQRSLRWCRNLSRLVLSSGHFPNKLSGQAELLAVIHLSWEHLTVYFIYPV